jgi:hypothetical protein
MIDAAFAEQNLSLFPDHLNHTSVGHWQVLVPHVEAPDDPILYQADELVCAGVEPSQVLAAFIALAKGPGMRRKPGVLQRWSSGLVTARRVNKGHNLELKPGGIGKNELILSSILEPVLFVGNSVEAPRTKPIPGGIGCCRGSPF